MLRLRFNLLPQPGVSIIRAAPHWQSIDVVMLAGWAGLVGWVLLRH
jgi:hypothetical protein